MQSYNGFYEEFVDRLKQTKSRASQYEIPLSSIVILRRNIEGQPVNHSAPFRKQTLT